MEENISLPASTVHVKTFHVYKPIDRAKNNMVKFFTYPHSFSDNQVTIIISNAGGQLLQTQNHK